MQTAFDLIGDIRKTPPDEMNAKVNRALADGSISLGDSHLLKAYILQAAGRIDEGLGECRAAITLEPRAMANRRLLVELQLQAGNPSEASIAAVEFLEACIKQCDEQLAMEAAMLVVITAAMGHGAAAIEISDSIREGYTTMIAGRWWRFLKGASVPVEPPWRSANDS